MTQKAKGPAEAATSTPSQVQSPDKGKKNVDSNNTQNAGGATELPVQRINRIAKELSAALNDMDDHYLVLVYPSSSREYPVHICLDRDFADLMQKAIKYLEGDK